MYGTRVKVQSDHKPLEAIITKPISRAPARLQRMLPQIQKYDIAITYSPGKQMAVADTLSRAVQPMAAQEDADLGEEKTSARQRRWMGSIMNN